NAQDSTVVRTVFPDKKGDFTFTGIAPGSYRVRAVLVGFDDGISEPITVTSEASSKTIGTLVLRSGNTVLDEVTVAAPQRPLVERRADMLVVNRSEERRVGKECRSGWVADGVRENRDTVDGVVNLRARDKAE